MGSNSCLVNPAKEEYFEPDDLMGADTFRYFLNDRYTRIVLKNLISDCDGTLLLRARWVGDPVILASSSSSSNLYFKAKSSFNNISYLALVDLCYDEEILDEMIDTTWNSSKFLVHFVNAFSLLEPLKFHASIQDRLGSKWKTRYLEYVRECSWLSHLDWHRIARE
ncbi:hypothetical protein [Gimesia chilikensis]|uniref:hypothetical protein n=1 Tax=Gimesia chilikensis TaxID=2605989 RepID=UPI00118814F3|nr:hypothetical protein [Gimesia chilikensis]QDT86634.1 hypothetical protein MalM14_43120 [Gimesia chilikensis]